MFARGNQWYTRTNNDGPFKVLRLSTTHIRHNTFMQSSRKRSMQSSTWRSPRRSMQSSGVSKRVSPSACPYGPKFSQFHMAFWKIWQNHRLASPPSMGNPGSILQGLHRYLCWDLCEGLHRGLCEIYAKPYTEVYAEIYMEIYMEVHGATGRERLIQRFLSARISFKLSGNLNETMPCNSNFGQNFELEISLN